MVLEKRLEENVTFTGFMGGKDKNEALVASDMVVQLSRFEQGAWAPMEGVLCGTPIVVTSDTGTGEDVKRLKAGYTVDFDDVKMLSTTFDNILQNYDEALKVTDTFIIENLSMNARVVSITICLGRRMKSLLRFCYNTFRHFLIRNTEYYQMIQKRLQ